MLVYDFSRFSEDLDSNGGLVKTSLSLSSAEDDDLTFLSGGIIDISYNMYTVFNNCLCDTDIVWVITGHKNLLKNITLRI